MAATFFKNARYVVMIARKMIKIMEGMHHRHIATKGSQKSRGSQLNAGTRVEIARVSDDYRDGQLSGQNDLSLSLFTHATALGMCP